MGLDFVKAACVVITEMQAEVHVYPNDRLRKQCFLYGTEMHGPVHTDQYAYATEEEAHSRMDPTCVHVHAASMVGMVPYMYAHIHVHT